MHRFVILLTGLIAMIGSVATAQVASATQYGVIKYDPASFTTVGTGSNAVFKANPAVRYNAQTGTTYTLTESDNGKLVTLTNAATVTVTLAPGLSTGWNCVLEQTGAGAVVWVNGSGVTNNTYPASATKTTAQRARVTVEHRGSNVFCLNGQIVP